MDFNLKNFRKDFNLKQLELQEILGVTQGFISRVENKKESFPETYYEKLAIKYGEIAIKKYVVNTESSFNQREKSDSLEVSTLIKAIEILSEIEKNNADNIKELIAQGKQQTENMTKLVDLLCKSGIEVPIDLESSKSKKGEDQQERKANKGPAHTVG